MTSTAERTGSRRAPRTPVPSRASTTTAAFSTPLANMATSRGAARWTLTMPLSRATRSQLRADETPARPGIRGDDRDDHRRTGKREPPRGHEAVAPVVAGTAQDDDRAGPPPADVRGQRPDRGGDRCPGMLHQPQLGVAERLGAPVGAGHRLGRDGGQVGLRRPVLAQPAQVHLEDRRVVGRQERSSIGSRGLECWGHRPRSVAEVRARAGVPGAARRYEPARSPCHARTLVGWPSWSPTTSP